jgi:hypothetical protein
MFTVTKNHTTYRFFKSLLPFVTVSSTFPRTFLVTPCVISSAIAEVRPEFFARYLQYSLACVLYAQWMKVSFLMQRQSDESSVPKTLWCYGNPAIKRDTEMSAKQPMCFNNGVTTFQKSLNNDRITFLGPLSHGYRNRMRWASRWPWFRYPHRGCCQVLKPAGFLWHTLYLQASLLFPYRYTLLTYVFEHFSNSGR